MDLGHIHGGGDKVGLDDWLGIIGFFGWIASMFGFGKGEEGHEGEKSPRDRGVSTLKAIFSKTDEGVWAALLACLDESQKKAITALMTAMKPLERWAFRLVVANMPLKVEIIEEEVKGKKGAKTKKKVRKEEFTDNDIRVRFLKDLAEAIGDGSDKEKVKEVLHMLRKNELARESRAARAAMKTWRATVRWVKKVICQFFGVDELSAITPDMIADKLNAVAEKIPDRTKKQMGEGFWTWMHRTRRKETYAILVFGIVLAVSFIFVSIR